MKNYAKILLVPLFLFVLFAALRTDTFAATRTWTGGGGSSNTSWSNTANWQGGLIPANGDNLVFPSGVTNVLSINNIPNLSLVSIDINDNYTLNSSSAGLTLNTSVINTNIPVNKSSQFSIDNITTNLTVNSNGEGSLILNNKIGSGVSNPLTLTYNVTTGHLIDNATFNSNGASTTLTKDGAGSLYVFTTKTYSGNNILKGGRVVNGSTNGFGTGPLILGSTNNLDTIFETGSITNNIIAKAVSNGKKITLSTAYLSFETLSGNITTDSSGPSTLEFNTIRSGDYGFIVTGTISENSPTNKLSIIKSGSGIVTYKNSTNTYTGPTTINDGDLKLENASAAWTKVSQSDSSNKVVLSKNSTLGGFDAKSIYAGDFNLTNGYKNNISGNLNIIGTFDIKFNSLNTGEYSNLFVNGNVTIDPNSSLSNWTDSNLNLNPTIGNTYDLISTTGTVTGTFYGLPNNTIYPLGDKFFKIVYSSNKVSLVAITSPVVVYRFENKNDGLHHFTLDQGEADYLSTSDYGKANWNYEGPKFTAFKTQEGNLQPVYRFFNIYNGQHFLTISSSEASFLRDSVYGKANWQDEGISFYAGTEYGHSLPVFRFAHKVNGEHFYTVDGNEANFLRNSDYGKAIWDYEGIGFYTYGL